MTGVFSKAQHQLFTRHDPIHLGDVHGASSSSCDDSSEASPSSSPTTDSHLPGAAVTITDVFEHPTHTVTRTVIRPPQSHSLFSLPFRRSASSPLHKSGSRSFLRTPEQPFVTDVRSTFEEDLDAHVQRWEDEREGRNVMDVYIVVERESSHEESWRSLVQEVHYNHRTPTRKVSGECGRW
jgi:hypothetical protein